jgi:hypothetical protein
MTRAWFVVAALAASAALLPLVVVEQGGIRQCAVTYHPIS